MTYPMLSLATDFEKVVDAMADRPDCLVIDLPWIDSALLPNNKGGKHWAFAYKANTQARSDATIATRQALRLNPVTFDEHKRLIVIIVCLPPDDRRRDDDGIQSALKPSLDAIAHELGIDDRRFNPLLIYRGKKILGGKITIALVKV